MRFPNGVPPINTIALIANFRAFTGCDLGAFAPIRALRAGRQANAPFTFPLGTDPVAVSIEGAGAAPRVTLISPSGERFDYTTGAEHGKFLNDTFGAVVTSEDRSVIMIHHPERGMWTAEPAGGSAPIARVQSAPVLPDPKVTAKVTGKGTKRVLRYRIAKLPGQVVDFVEQVDGGYQVLRSVKGGGTGKVPFTVVEADGTRRTIAAQVNQDGIPRQRIEVAHFVAPSPQVGTPRVRVRRHGGQALVTWSKAALAAKYSTTVTYGDGRTELFTTDAKHRSVTVPAVGKAGGLGAQVTAFSRTGRHGRTATARLQKVKPKKHKRHKHHHAKKHKKG